MTNHCAAVTNGHGSSSRCWMQASRSSHDGLCYYHEKMRRGLIEPNVRPVEPATSIVVMHAATGEIIWSGRPR